MADLLPRYAWVLPPPHPLDAATIEDARARGVSARALRVLSRRAAVDRMDLAARFDPPEQGLHDPALLPDADRLAERVRMAVARSERVMVFGDFDADGLTGLAILVLALRRRGLDVEPHVPSRLDEGHGLSTRAVDEAAAGGRTLILTADTGSTSGAEIDLARAAGIDVIVTDHHVLPRTWPAAIALVNPHRPDGRYPDRRLSGAGVAFKVAQLLLAHEPGGPAAALDLADLAAIGSVADVVPMAGENRAILRLGLERLARRPRPGVAALLAAAGASPDRLDLESIGFGLAPRLNAMGRVGDPRIAADLLLAQDEATAAILAGELEAANDLRRELTAAALAEAREQAEATPTGAATVLAGDWPVGVIGIVAGRLAEELGRPTVVVTTQTRPWRGSARSAGGFDLAAAFDACADLFERHGGHPAAAGCHVEEDRFAEFAERFTALAAARPVVERRPTLSIDLVQSATSVDHVLFRELTVLEASGEAPALVGIAGLVVTRTRAANGGHTQLTLRKGMDVIDGISFGRSDLAEVLHEGQVVDVVARLGSRTFAGLETLQLEVRDVAQAGALAGLRDAMPEPAAIGVGSAGAVTA